MNRRALLRVAAGVLGGGAATAAGLSVATESAAQTALTLEVDGDSANIGTDGSVSEVQLDLDVEWAYDLPSETSPSTVVRQRVAGDHDRITSGLPHFFAASRTERGARAILMIYLQWYCCRCL